MSNGAGRFAVLGSHAYRDAETFSAIAHIARVTPSAAAAAWSEVQAIGFTGPKHLPPFSASHLVGQISQAGDAQGNAIPIVVTSGTGANAQSRFSVSIVVINSGNLPSKPGTFRFYLSKDTVLNTVRVGSQPADIPLAIGTFREGGLPALPPGAGLRYDLVRSVNSNGSISDLRLIPPVGQSGASYFLLAHLGYSDPLANQLPITKDVTIGRLDGIAVNKTGVVVTEAAGATHLQTFTVVLKGIPLADVRIPLTRSETTQVTLDKTELTFTRQNWNVPQTVTLTAIDDTIDEDTTTTTIITIGPTVSTDESWDAMSGGTVRVFVTDNDPA